MDPRRQFRHNEECPARGKVGGGNIRVHSRGEKRYKMSYEATYTRPGVTATRWANQASLMTGVPVASIGANDKGARVGPFVVPGQAACYECAGLTDLEYLVPEETAPLMGTTVAMLAGIMVQEIVKLLTGFTEPSLLGRSLYIDTSTLEFTFTEHARNPKCPACSGVGQRVA